ncbi:MAG: PatA/PatG family cyanobactin maturation protease [Spirulina sp.]
MPNLVDIPGFCELQTLTQGDPRITIAVLDGVVDLQRTCFEGANLSQIQPFWSEEVAIPPQSLDIFRELHQLDDFDEQKMEKLAAAIPDERIRHRLFSDFHATHVSSIIFGQPNSAVEGIAFNCRGINIPIETDGENFINPLNLVRAFNHAIELGAHIIHCAACHPTQSGVAHELLEKSVSQAQANNILVVAPAGNDGGECWCIPAVLENVLTVGAYKENGQPTKYGNFGGRYQKQGILAPGENILGAQLGTDEPIRKRGTSCAAPIVTGVAALLMSLQLKQGAAPDAEAVRAAITNSAIPCDREEVEEPERCLLGKLNIAGAFASIAGEPLTALEVSASGEIADPVKSEETESEIYIFADSQGTIKSSRAKTLEEQQTLFSPALASRSARISPAPSLLSLSQTPDIPTTVLPGRRFGLVYALGILGYDLGTEARRDSFKQLMPPVNIDGLQFPANPDDARQMVDYLDESLFEAKSLIWTLNLEFTPIYAIEPIGAFADDAYETLLQLLDSEILPKDDPHHIEIVSIAGRLTKKTKKLFSGQILPVVEIYSSRGIYGWTIDSLIENALSAVRDEREDDNERAMRRSLKNFLQRVYYDLRNLGQTDRDRALNFAATNAFQAADTIADALAIGMELHSIEVEKSPFCRYNSNCWDVKLKFFDPDRSRRAKRVFRFTIDVVDLMPVTLGEVRSWAVPK